VTESELVPVVVGGHGILDAPGPGDVESKADIDSSDLDATYVYPEDPAPSGKKWVLVDDDSPGIVAYVERPSDPAEANGIPDPVEDEIPMNHTSDGTDESEEYGW
jgi:hypothetical protein